MAKQSKSTRAPAQFQQTRNPRAEVGEIRPRRVEATRQSLAGILTLVRDGDASTRLALEQATGLGRATIVDRLTTLTRYGLLAEDTLGPAQGGRAPRLIRFRAGSGLILVAFLDRSVLGVGVADLNGRLLVEHHEAIELSTGPQAVLGRLMTLFDWALEQHQADRDVWAIGVAVPGPVELSAGEPFASPVFHFDPSWWEFDFVEQLAARFRAPVWVRSAVECMTLGERKAGNAQDSDNFLFVKLGRGISTALFADGRLVRGAQGAGGLLGHILQDPNSDEVCHCGNTGCLEIVAGGDAIARDGANAARDGQSPQLARMLEASGEITANDVGMAAQLGDSFCTELLARRGQMIGVALAAVANTVNPSTIVLGGDIVQTGDVMLSAVRQAVYLHAHPLTTRELRIVKSQMGGSAGLLGAAEVAVGALFAGPSLENWIAYGSPLDHPEFAARLSQATTDAADDGTTPAPPPAARNQLEGGKLT